MTSLPRTTWESEEVRFVDALLTYDPLEQQPEPPGYPLYVGLGRLVNFFVRNPFAVLLALSVTAAVAGVVVTALAASELLGNAWAGAAAALTLYLSPAMLVFDPLPNAEAATVACLSMVVLALVRRRPLLFALFSGAVVGLQPEMAVAVSILVVGGAVMMRSFFRTFTAYVVVALVCIAPLIEAVGFGRFAAYCSASFGSLQAASAASGLTAKEAVLRFVAHPWGAKFLAFPLLLVAAAGFLLLVRRRREFVVLALFAAAHTAFCIAFADRSDGVQPVIPAMIAVSLFAAGALARWPAIAVAASFAFAASSYAYVLPILSERHDSASPPAAATAYARSQMSNAVILYDTTLEPYARHTGLPAFPLTSADPLRLPTDRPLFILADGLRSSWLAAKFAWDDSDAYGKITTESYRVVSISRWFTAEMIRPVSGVYEVQRDARGEEWRWLSRTAIIEVVPQDRTIAISLALPADAAIPRNEVTVTCGRESRVVTVARGENADVRIPLDSPRLTFRAANSFTPADGRQIAVQLVGVYQGLGHGVGWPITLPGAGHRP